MGLGMDQVSRGEGAGPAPIVPTEIELRVRAAMLDEPTQPPEDYFFRQVRAAIRAMREPTEEMKTAGLRTMDRYEQDHAALMAETGIDGMEPDYIWAAMIESASPERTLAKPLSHVHVLVQGLVSYPTLPLQYDWTCALGASFRGVEPPLQSFPLDERCPE